MTRQEFLNYASEQPRFNVYRELYSYWDLEKFFDKSYKNGSSSKKIVDFLNGVGKMLFERIESKSGDVLVIHVSSYGSSCNWQDIGCMVSEFGVIRNCAGTIESFFISEQGRFYNQNHKLLAENEEDFFDYLVTVEYDFHPEIPRRTYHILRHFGWYDGRHIDTAEFEQKMKHRGIDFTKAQLDFLGEFSGLTFELSDYYYWKIYSLDKILENYVPIAQPDAHRKVRIEDAFGCGDDGNGLIFLSSDGLLALGVNTPLGRTTMECINHLCNYSHENPPWLEKLLKQDEAV